MPHVGGQKLKILVLYQILMEKSDEAHQLNSTQLIELLGENGIPAERKSIYKDVSTLQEAGVDIIKGENGYYVGSRVFELAELKLLVDAVSASKFISEKKSRELLSKIEALTSEGMGKSLSRHVVVPDRVKTDNEKIFYSIDVIYQCIDDNRQMQFQYEEWTLDKKKSLRKDGAFYRVSPAFLIRNDENYYLVAYDELSMSIRHYRVDKIVNASELEAVRGGRQERSLLAPEEYAKKHVGMYAGEKKTVTLLCEKYLVGVLLDKFGTDITLREDKEKDMIRARISVEVSPQFYGWISGVGAVIVAPEAERDNYRSYLNGLINKMD